MKYIEIKADEYFITNLVRDSQNSFSVEEIEMFKNFVKSEDLVYFEAESFGNRISRNKGLLRTLFSPFIYEKKFLSIELFKGVICYASDKEENMYKINITLDKPIYLLEKGAYFESDLDENFIVKYIKEYMENNHGVKIYQMDYDYKIEVGETEKIYISSKFNMKIKDLSILIDNTAIKKRRSLISNDLFTEMLIYSGKHIDANDQNKKVLLKIVKKSGMVEEVFQSGIQFSKREIKEVLMKSMTVNRYNKNDIFDAAIKLIETQKAADTEIVSNLIAKFGNEKYFSKNLKKNKKILKKYKNDSATLLLITIM
jgi:hypothetical protein